jgi:Transglycosylase SLT domain
MAAGETLRFVLVGDDRASKAFSQFSKSVDSANQSVARNSKALGQQSKASGEAEKSLFSFTGTITGFSDAMTAGSSKSGLFAKALAAVNLATGIGEPALAGLTVAAGAAAAAFAAAGVGLGAYKLVIMNVQQEMEKLKQLQQAAATGSKTAGKALQLYIKGLSPAFKEFNAQLDKTKTAYRAWGTSLEAPVLGPLTRGLKFVKPLLADLSPIVRTASAAIGYLVDRLGTNIEGGGFAKWLAAIRPAIAPAITDLGLSIGHIVVGVGAVIKAFVPFAPKITGGIEHLTAAFAKWGTTLSSHSGFQSLVSMAKQDAPVVLEVLKNLAVTLKNVGSAMAAFSSPSNSLGLLNTLQVLTGILAKLSANKDLLNFVLQFLLLKSIAGQVLGPLKTAGAAISGVSGAVKTGTSAFTAFKAGFVNSAAAASSATGIWGSAGGAIADMAGAVKGWTIWSKIAAKATVVWTVVQKALNFALKDNPIGLVITAIGLLVGAVIYAYTHFKWFRDFVNTVWQGIQIEAKFTWHVIQDVWNAIVTAAKAVWHAIQDGWNAVWHAVINVAKWFVDRVLGFWSMILHGAIAAFGWIPGLGDKLRQAEAVLNRFHDRADKALTFKDKKVTIGVGFGVTLPGGKTFTGQARGGLIMGGIPGQDSVPGLLMPGEVVVPAGMVRAGAVDHLRGRLPGFAAGGMVGGGGLSVQPMFASVPVMAAAALKVIAHLAQQNIGSLLGAGTAGSGVARWDPVILTALRLLGQSPAWLGVVERRMAQESGGNPTVVNKWDSNWLAGTPSVGLMQVIGPTFAAYAGPFRGVGPFLYGTSVNPLANTYAGLNYALHRYGSLAALSRPGGYDQGGWLNPGWTAAYNGTGRPERVLPPGGGGDVYLTVNVNASPLAHPADIGRAVAGALQEYVKVTGPLKLKVRS